jgi:hypothetical protein
MQGFDKTSDTLDIVSSETQKVVSSSMEEEVHGRRVIIHKVTIFYLINFTL